MKGIVMTRQVLITKEEGWFVATDITSQVASQGKSLEEAMLNLKEALELYFDDSTESVEEEQQPAFLTTLEVFA